MDMSFLRLKKIKLLLLVVLFFSTQIAAIQVQAESNNKPKEIRVGWFLTAPFRLGTFENPSGVDFEILKVVAEKLGYSLKFVDSNIPRFLELSKTKEVDILSFLIVAPDREEVLHFLKPAYIENTKRTVYVQKGKGESFKVIADIEKMESVGVKLGAKYFAEFDQNEKINKVPTPGVDQNLKKLATGRLTGVMAVETEADYFIQSLKLGDMIEKSKYAVLDSTGKCCYFALAKTSPLMDKKDEIIKIISDLKSSGQIEKWIRQYTEVK